MVMGGGVGGGEWQWYMYVCVIRYMHAVSKFSVLFDGGGVGWEVGSNQSVCHPLTVSDQHWTRSVKFGLSVYVCCVCSCVSFSSGFRLSFFVCFLL